MVGFAVGLAVTVGVVVRVAGVVRVGIGVGFEYAVVVGVGIDRFVVGDGVIGMLTAEDFTAGISDGVGDACTLCGVAFPAGGELVEYADYVLHVGCLNSWLQNEAERSYDRYLSRFYGGEVPTEREQLLRAWALR